MIVIVIECFVLMVSGQGEFLKLIHLITQPEATIESIGFGSIFMKIGELAQVAQCTVETVRYYEKEGLLPAPARPDLWPKNGTGLDLSYMIISPKQ